MDSLTNAQRKLLRCLVDQELSPHGLLAEYGAARGARVKPHGHASVWDMVGRLQEAGLVVRYEVSQRTVPPGDKALRYRHLWKLTDAGRRALGLV